MRRRSLSQRTSAYVVSTFAVFLVVIASLIGASTAAAQSGGGGGGGHGGGGGGHGGGGGGHGGGGGGHGGGGGGHVSPTKKVQKWVKARALEVAQDQGPMFPNAEVSGRGSFASCTVKYDLELQKRPRFTCFFNIYIYEGSRSVPNQSTLRICKNYSDEKPSLDAPLRVKQNGRRLSIKGGWKQSCELDEFAISQWDLFGPAYRPEVTEATPHEVGEVAVEEITEPRDDLLPAGADPGPAPGPLGTGAPAARSESGKKARPAYAHTFCSQPGWVYFPNGWYAIYGCVWDEPNLNGLFGATPNLYAQNQWIELYYYANTGYYTLYQSGWYQRGGTSCADQYGTYCRPQGIDAVHNEPPGPLGD